MDHVGEQPDAPVSEEVAALLDACTTTCQLFAEQDEGPYRRGDQPWRRDVVEDREGAPLGLGLRVGTLGGEAAAGAEVEIWHCDADGRYSGYPPNDPTLAVSPSPQRAQYLDDQTFLRGRQTCDADGVVEFRTIYPGWYPGRAVHIHLMVHTPSGSFVSQLYFPEDLTAQVFRDDPYRAHGLPDTSHASDGIFATGGTPAVLDVRPAGAGHLAGISLLLHSGEAR